MAKNLEKTQLDRIEDKIDEINKSTYEHWARALGLGVIIASAGLVMQTVWLGVVLFILGYLLLVLPIDFLKKH